MIASTTRNSTATSSSGATCGSVMRQNWNHGLARSIAAASYKYSGMALRPDRHKSITKGLHIHISTITTAQKASLGLASQSGPVPP